MLTVFAIRSQNVVFFIFLHFIWSWLALVGQAPNGVINSNSWLLSLQNLIAIFCTNKNPWVKKEIQRKIHCFISAQVPQPSSENADFQGYQT